MRTVQRLTIARQNAFAATKVRICPAEVKRFSGSKFYRHSCCATRAHGETVMSTDRRSQVRPSSRRERAPREPSAPSQADLFDGDVAAVEHAPRDTVPKRRVEPARSAPTQTVTLADIPPYERDDLEIVDASLAEAPSAKLWFTYADIRRYFGVSRATVARKVKARLVPGIRFEGARVVEEGAVRRFSRTQVRYVLLAVRRRDWRSLVS